MAGSCWRKKNSFYCLDSSSAVAEAIFFDNSDIEAFLAKCRQQAKNEH